jgi:hypothetical protein
MLPAHTRLRWLGRLDLGRGVWGIVLAASLLCVYTRGGERMRLCNSLVRAHRTAHP